MARTLGLDLGPNSIGWALIDDKTHTIIASGVRIFQEGVAHLNEGDREEPWNKQRRDARGARVNTARYRQRRNQLKEILIRAGLMPDPRKGQDSFFKIDPYEVRQRGLNEKLSLHEFGRALYHLNQRRGFKSNRKTDTSEDSKIFKGTGGKTGITATAEAIEASGSRTLGEFLARLDPHQEQRRNRYTLRQMYTDEFDQLWIVQARHWPSALTVGLKEDIRDIIFYQRPLKSQKHTIGYCTLEPSKRRAPASSPTFQTYRILEQVTRLTVTEDRRISEPLTPEERTELIHYLEGRKDASFDDIKKRLNKICNLSLDAHFNLEDQKKLKGNRTCSELVKVFGKKQWAEKTDSEGHKIWHTLHFADDPEWLATYAKNRWGLGAEQVKKLLKISLEPGYGSLSHKAMTKIIPYLDAGQVYSDAAKSAGYHHSRISKYPTGASHLPEPEKLRNPLVQQAMYELRRVVNAILETYGKPDRIRVELARDLKLPKKLRQQITKDIKATGEKADRIREELREELGFSSPSREDVQKYILWEECKKVCPYTGREISLPGLYSGDFEIEHILPYSRSGNNSMANKTICWEPENRAKGERTPYEAYSHDDERYQAILARVKKAMPLKHRKFTQKELEGEFVNRQLVDTAYFSREAKAYLESICDNVEASPGRATARLRGFWGLHKILSKEIDVKNRDDHRHHAVDALVVACTTRSHVHRLSLYNEYHREANREKFPKPWDTFYEDSMSSINAILVSHRIKNRPRGKLHEETNYGEITLPNGNKSFVMRKSLEALKPHMIGHIVDRGVQRAVEDRLAEFGVTDIVGKFTLPKGVFKDPLPLEGAPYPIKSARVAVTSNTMRQLYPRRNLWVEPGNNHHVVIFQDARGKQEGNVVSLLEVATRQRLGQPLIDKTPSEGFTFLMILVRNDMVLVDVEEDDLDWGRPDLAEAATGQLYRVQKFDANGIIILRQHTVAILKDEEGNEPGVLRKSISTLRGLKVSIDPTGRITPAHD